jgi:energy-coupling factor transporter ATP-binding protein EcfA2
MHFLLVANSGSGKSTLLKQIEKLHPAHPKVYTNITNAGLVGTITENQAIPGAAWDSYMRPLLIDEFMISHKTSALDNINGLLQILEHGEYRKKIGMTCFPVKEEKKGGYYWMVDRGEIAVRTKLNAIIVTMRKLEHARNPATEALVSRCIPFWWNISQNEIEEMLKGKMLFDLDMNALKKDKNRVVEIQTDDYLRILNYVITFGIDKELLARAVCDCCRAYAVFGMHNENVYKIICELKQEFINKRKDFYHQKTFNIVGES